jgi:hypothetical protein
MPLCMLTTACLPYAGKAGAKRSSSWGVRLISGTITSAWAAGSASSTPARAQIDLGLAAAGAAVQQEGAGVLLNLGENRCSALSAISGAGGRCAASATAWAPARLGLC